MRVTPTAHCPWPLAPGPWPVAPGPGPGLFCLGASARLQPRFPSGSARTARAVLCACACACAFVQTVQAAMRPSHPQGILGTPVFLHRPPSRPLALSPSRLPHGVHGVHGYYCGALLHRGEVRIDWGYCAGCAAAYAARSSLDYILRWPAPECSRGYVIYTEFCNDIEQLQLHESVYITYALAFDTTQALSHTYTQVC